VSRTILARVAPGHRGAPGEPAGSGGAPRPPEHTVELPYPPAEAMRAVVSAAEDWGAELEPGAGPGVRGGPDRAGGPSGAGGSGSAGGPGGASGPGGSWGRGATGGQLRLPVAAGLRRGWVSGPLAIEESAQGSRVTFTPVAQDYYLETSAVAVLVMAGAGALLSVAWPLFPGLLPTAPFGMVLAVAGWMLIVSRLRARGPAEFLATVAHRPGGPGGPPADGVEGNSGAPGGGI
jgi:hypothetical protein